MSLDNKVMWDDTSINVSKEVAMVWSIANKLRGPYKPDKYKDVIIPMTIIRRFECALEDTKAKVLEVVEKIPNAPAKKLCQTLGYDFYNTSRYTLKELLNDSDNIADNFISYLNGFSSNVQDIINSLEFAKENKKDNKTIEQKWIYETGREESEILGSGSSYYDVFKTNDEEQALKELMNGYRNYLIRYKKKNGITIARQWYDCHSKSWIDD